LQCEICSEFFVSDGQVHSRVHDEY
jgi:hypothetical protein